MIETVDFNKNTIDHYNRLFEPEVRKQARENPIKFAIDNQLIVGDTDIEVVLKENTANKIYILIYDSSLENLGSINAPIPT